MTDGQKARCEALGFTVQPNKILKGEVIVTCKLCAKTWDVRSESLTPAVMSQFASRLKAHVASDAFKAAVRTSS